MFALRLISPSVYVLRRPTIRRRRLQDCGCFDDAVLHVMKIVVDIYYNLCTYVGMTIVRCLLQIFIWYLVWMVRPAHSTFATLCLLDWTYVWIYVVPQPLMLE